VAVTLIYQVRANLFFTEADEARDFYHDCELALEKSQVVNPASPNSEYPVIDLIENHHDEDPNASCNLLLTDTKVT